MPTVWRSSPRFTPDGIRGRAVHIHFKIRTSLNDNGYEFTSQFFFNDSLSDQVFCERALCQQGVNVTD
jgi:hypothetical protein